MASIKYSHITAHCISARQIHCVRNKKTLIISFKNNLRTEYNKTTKTTVEILNMLNL